MLVAAFGTLDGEAYQRGKRVPGPKCQHEAHPRKEEDPSMPVDRIQNGYTAGFLVDGVEHWRPPEVGCLEAHPEVTAAEQLLKSTTPSLFNGGIVYVCEDAV